MSAKPTTERPAQLGDRALIHIAEDTLGGAQLTVC
jgi:hypothetical protein